MHTEYGKDANKLLGRLAPFQFLPIEERRRVASTLTRIQMARGDVLLRSGTDGKFVYLLEQGSLQMIGACCTPHRLDCSAAASL